MELSGKYYSGLAELEKAISGFELALNINLEEYNSVEADLMKNGWLQKFEYCTELSWKLSKIFMEWKAGITISSPKNVYREMLLAKYIDENLCDNLFQTINDRNSMSHIYKEEMFDLILQNIHQHKNAFKRLLILFKSDQF